MTSPTIACSGPVGEVAVEILKPFGNIVVADDSSEEALLQILEGAVGLILRGDGIGSNHVIEAAADLKVIGRSGVGYDKVDIQTANARRIPVIITPGANSQAVAEASLTYMLALSKKMIHWDIQLKQGNWKSRFEQSLVKRCSRANQVSLATGDAANFSNREPAQFAERVRA